MAITLSIEDALQSISRSEASGVLKIGDSIEAVFVRGALSHIDNGSIGEVSGICGLLQDAGCLADSVVELVKQADMAVGQLGELLISKQYLSEEEFRRARQSFQKNKLFQLIGDDDVQAEFSLDRTIRSNDDSLNILAAELLLDIVGMRTAQKELLEASDSEDLKFRLASEYQVKGLTLEEVIVVKLLQQSGVVTLDEIEKGSLMSKAELFIALRVLRDKEILLLGEEEEEIQAELDSEEQEEILSDLFDDELEAVVDEGVDEQGDDANLVSEGYWGGEDSIEEDSSSSLSVENEQQFEMSPLPELEPGSNKWADNEADGCLDSGSFALGLRLRMLNYRLTETTAVMHVVLVVTILYLVVLAWLMPNLLREWFDALSGFTSFSG